MAEHPDKPVHVRAETYAGWHIQIPNNPIFESAFGQISRSQSHHLCAENYVSRQQDGVGCSKLKNPSLPKPLHSRQPMQRPQDNRNYHFSPFDSAHIGLGSDIGSTKFEARHAAANDDYTEAFKNQPVQSHAKPFAHESRSPISDLSGPTEPSLLGPNTADFESWFGFDAPAAPAFGSLPQASSHSVTDASPRALTRISPYTSSRGRSHSDGLLAVSRTQHQPPRVNSTIDMVAPDPHSSQSSGSPELALSTAEIDVELFSQSRSTFFSHSQFDSSTFDFAMAFAEASYSAQTLEDTPSPALQASLRSAVKPSNSTSSHCEDFPPDLFAHLDITPLIPPLSENVRHQSLRFPADLYTPSYVRNHGIEREGWCGICRPGRWLVLKNSAFWYDKSFKHGVSAASGTRFKEPAEVRRTTGNVDGDGAEQCDGWEGLCGTCEVWVTLGGGKRGGVPWFRHAYKCHTHSKAQDMPKRRRESKGERRSKTMSSKRVDVGDGNDCADENDREPM